MIYQKLPSHHGECATCRSFHPLIAPSSPPHCFFVTIRRSGRSPLPYTHVLGDNTAVLVPTSLVGKVALRDVIWAEFESIKVENDYSRQQMVTRRSSRKGELRKEAPIPWLSWRSPWGQEGQTRNGDNFVHIWDKMASGPGSMWLTCTFLSSIEPSTEDPAIANRCPTYGSPTCFKRGSSSSDEGTPSEWSSCSR